MVHVICPYCMMMLKWNGKFDSENPLILTCKYCDKKSKVRMKFMKIEVYLEKVE
jgi:hypothetical protein